MNIAVFDGDRYITHLYCWLCLLMLISLSWWFHHNMEVPLTNTSIEDFEYISDEDIIEDADYIDDVEMISRLRPCQHCLYCMDKINNTNQNHMSEIKTKPKVPRWCTGNVKFRPVNKSAPIVALTSHPGSGNTWLRYLIQQATGMFIINSN